jgi:Flp pilus assembly protein TadG
MTGHGRRWMIPMRRQRGQATVESALLLAVLLGVGLAAGAWMVRAHPQMLQALDIAARSYSFALSLPVP